MSIRVINELKVIFKQSGMSVQQLANVTGLTKFTVNNVLNGENDNPNLQTVIDLSSAMGAEIALITEESETAINQSDVSFYREAMGVKDTQITDLTQQITDLNSQLETCRKELAYTEKEFNKLSIECSEVKAEFRSYRSSAKSLTRVFMGIIIAFIVVIVVLAIIDLSMADIGWFRRLSDSLAQSSDMVTKLM